MNNVKKLTNLNVFIGIHTERSINRWNSKTTFKQKFLMFYGRK